MKEQQSDGKSPDDPIRNDIDQYRADLHRFLMRRLRSADDARDIAQEAYLRYLQLSDASAVRKPDAYIFKIAMNLVYEWRLRSDRSAVTYDSNLAEARSLTWADASLDVCEESIAREQLQRVLDQIPFTYRQVLLMNKVEGLSYHEIATKLNLAPLTVLKYLARATAYARRAVPELDRN